MKIQINKSDRNDAAGIARIGPSNDKPQVLEQPSDLIFEIPLKPNEQGAAAENTPDGMTIESNVGAAFFRGAADVWRSASGIIPAMGRYGFS